MLLRKVLQGITKNNHRLFKLSISRVAIARLLNWLTDKPTWVEQLPMRKRKITGTRTAATGAPTCSTH